MGHTQIVQANYLIFGPGQFVSKLNTAINMPEIGRTEMLSTVPCSKVRGASFLKNKKNEVSNGCLHAQNRSYRNVKHRSV